MTDVLRMTIPYPPSVNRYWRNWRGRMVMSNEGRNYKERVKSSFMDVVDLTKLNRLVSDKSIPVHLTINVFRPRKSGDLDNTLKAILDALKGIAYADDSQVVRILATRGDDKDNPRVEVICGTGKVL